MILASFYEVLMDATSAYLLSHSISSSTKLNMNKKKPPSGIWFMCFLIAFFSLLQVCDAYGARIPGEDVSDKMEAAGSLLKLTDTLLFNWVTKILSGVCLLTGSLALKDQRFPIFIMCVLAALLLGTISLWVKNIWSVGGGSTLFSMVEQITPMVSFYA
jgi:hypothetical protein